MNATVRLGTWTMEGVGEKIGVRPVGNIGARPSDMFWRFSDFLNGAHRQRAGLEVCADRRDRGTQLGVVIP